jgi:hypothetical protein
VTNKRKKSDDFMEEKKFCRFMCSLSTNLLHYLVGKKIIFFSEQSNFVGYDIKSLLYAKKNLFRNAYVLFIVTMAS